MGDGYEGRQTPKKQTKISIYMMEGAQSVVLRSHTMVELRIITETFILFSYSDTTQNLLCTVKAKSEQKHGTRNFVGYITIFLFNFGLEIL